MKAMRLCTYSFFAAVIFVIVSCSGNKKDQIDTLITKWQDDKSGAVSITFDDGTINQFRVAMPLLDSLGFPATFFIVTGDVPGSKYQPKFIGRSPDLIIRETGTVPTDENNLFERASLANYAPYEGMRDYFSQAGELYEDGRIREACQVIDKAYAKLRNHQLRPIPVKDASSGDAITWEEIRQYASRGHEFSSHTITHPRLAILDSANLLHELEKSRQEIREQLGPKYVFSAECPYGTENERVMKYALKIYPALRNRMPEPFLEELNRSSDKTPGSSGKEYVQWQRGALTDTPVDLMKSWIDTCSAKDNIWLVLVFHGVEGIGWEPLPQSEYRSYYSYLKSKEDHLWVATFGDVAKYMRERMNARAETVHEKGSLLVKLTHNLGPEYDLPLTMKTYIPESSGTVSVNQGNSGIIFREGKDATGRFLLYRLVPNTEPVKITLR
jgi:peptidoglycan/xylan/chitin deacetylase (PgdA/CDA1 family)